MSTRCITAGQLPGSYRFPSGRKTFIWGVKEYKVVRVKRQRVKKDEFIWKLDKVLQECLGDTMPRDIVEAAKKIADKKGLPYVEKMKQNTPAVVSDLEAMLVGLENE